MPFGCAALGAAHTDSSIRSASSSEKTEQTLVARGTGVEDRNPSRGDYKNGPECNSGVFPQETEPKAGGGGAGESEYPEA